MGKGRDKRKKHEDPSKAAARASKQAAKLKRKNKSGENNNSDDVVLYNEEPIEVTLKRIQKAESKVKTVQELEKVSPPSPRVNVVLCLHPSRDQELIIFGGEYYNGELTQAYNDVYFYHLKRNTWAKLSTAINPPPRSSSQGIAYKDYMIIFGGEFVSQSQSQFLHFRDVWRFDVKRSEWTELKNIKGSPSSRSGHRMVLWKRQAVVFGGFYDNAQECHYYNDLWLLSAMEGSGHWRQLTTAGGSEVPQPRSGHTMSVHHDTLFVFGGYSTAKFNRFKKSEATVHHDLWMTQLPPEGDTAAALRGVMWVKIRLEGVPPPIRCGVGSCFKDRKMFFFGGVVDIESPGGQVTSTFSNDLFVFHMDSKRFYPVVLRRPRKSENRLTGQKKMRLNDLDAELKAICQGEQVQSSSSSDDEEEEEDSSIDLEDELEEKAEGEVKSQEMRESFTKNKFNQITPHRRMDAAIAIGGNYLYLYGGQFESNNKEITMSDLYALNLNRLESFEVLLSQDLSAAVWMGKEESEGSAKTWETGSTVVSAAFGYYGDDDDDEETEDDRELDPVEEEEEAVAGGGPFAHLVVDHKPKHVAGEAPGSEGENFELPAELPFDATQDVKDLGPAVDGITRTGKKGLKVHKAQLLAQLSAGSGVPTPAKEELFQDFYKRTGPFWEQIVRDAQEIKMKDRRVKKEAVEFCRRRYHEAKELLEQLRIVEEQEREEALYMKERRLQKEKEWEAWEQHQREIEEEEMKEKTEANEAPQEPL